MSSSSNNGGGGDVAEARVTIICSVCTEPLMKDGSVPVATPCGHVFHKSCLTKWYKDPKRNTSKEQYCCPYCWKTTESDSGCNFRLYLNTEEDSEYLAVLQTVTQLRREKEEIIERMSQENAKALERLSEEKVNAVDLLRRENSKEKQLLRQLIQRQDDLIQRQKKEMQLLTEDIQSLTNPILLLQKRAKTVASEVLQLEVDGLMKTFKRLEEAGGSNSGGGVEATGLGGGDVAAVLPQGHHPTFPKNSTSGQVQGLAAAGGSATSSSSTTSLVGKNVTNPLSKSPDLQIIWEKQKIDDNSKKRLSRNPTVQKKQTDELIQRNDESGSEEVDDEVLTYTCDKCPRKFFNSEEAEEHRQSHTERKRTASSALNDSAARKNPRKCSSGKKRRGKR